MPFDRLGLLADMAQLSASASDEFADQYNPAWFVKYKGKSLMAYLYTNSYGVIYNTDMLKKAGLEPPTDWEELRKVLRKLYNPSQQRGRHQCLPWKA